MLPARLLFSDPRLTLLDSRYTSQCVPLQQRTCVLALAAATSAAADFAAVCASAARSRAEPSALASCMRRASCSCHAPQLPGVGSWISQSQVDHVLAELFEQQ